MYFLLNMRIFHCYVSLPKGISDITMIRQTCQRFDHVALDLFSYQISWVHFVRNGQAPQTGFKHIELHQKQCSILYYHLKLFTATTVVLIVILNTNNFNFFHLQLKQNPRYISTSILEKYQPFLPNQTPPWISLFLIHPNKTLTGNQPHNIHPPHPIPSIINHPTHPRPGGAISNNPGAFAPNWPSPNPHPNAPSPGAGTGPGGGKPLGPGANPGAPTGISRPGARPDRRSFKQLRGFYTHPKWCFPGTTPTPQVSTWEFLETPWKFNSSPLKSYRNPTGKDRLPTTFFQGRTVELRGSICVKIIPG